jgi:hypothetical protein
MPTTENINIQDRISNNILANGTSQFARIQIKIEMGFDEVYEPWFRFSRSRQRL